MRTSLDCRGRFLMLITGPERTNLLSLELLDRTVHRAPCRLTCIWTMPLSLPAMKAAIVCDDKELEAYDVKQEGTSSLTAFIASEAGKVRTFFRPTHSLRNLRNQTFCNPAIQNQVLQQFEQL